MDSAPSKYRWIPCCQPSGPTCVDPKVFGAGPVMVVWAHGPWCRVGAAEVTGIFPVIGQEPFLGARWKPLERAIQTYMGHRGLGGRQKKESAGNADGSGNFGTFSGILLATGFRTSLGRVFRVFGIRSPLKPYPGGGLRIPSKGPTRLSGNDVGPP